VEHSLPPPEAAVRFWRTRTLVLSAVAAVELFVILGLGIALFGKPIAGALHDAAVAQATGADDVKHWRPTEKKPALAREETSVLVLNGNGETGAAAATAKHVRRRGYRIGGVGNARRADYPGSVVMYRRGFRAEARRLASDLRLATVSPLDGITRRELGRAHVVLIVGG
jgi:hypothetical protein